MSSHPNETAMRKIPGTSPAPSTRTQTTPSLGRAPGSSLGAPRETGPLCGTRTLLEVVEAIREVTSNEEEIDAALTHMLRSGRVRLAGTTKGWSTDSPLSPPRRSSPQTLRASRLPMA